MHCYNEGYGDANVSGGDLTLLQMLDVSGRVMVGFVLLNK